MNDHKISPYILFVFLVAGFLLFYPVLQVRLAATDELVVTRNIDLLIATLFFVLCCTADVSSSWARILVLISPIGLVLILLTDNSIASKLLANANEGYRNAILVGAALFILGLFLKFNNNNLLRFTSDDVSIAQNQCSLLSTRPYLALLVITMTILFLEIVLIRYAASQIRIFSFYKNIPLIAAFLGLGLGCFKSKAGKAHILQFFLLLALTLALLSQITLFFDQRLSRLAAFASTEFILGDTLAISPGKSVAAQVSTTIAIAVIFLLIGALFTNLGRFLGDALEQVERLRGYTVDIFGSLLGIILFAALGYAWAPPPIWITIGIIGLALVVPRERMMLPLVPIAAFCIFAVWPGIGETVWSPYQKIIGQKVDDGFNLDISDVYFQRARYFKPYDQVSEDEIKSSRYYLTFWQHRDLDRVLVVGAGTGNETAVALLAGAKQVDAVEIDPAIVDFGRRYHPNKPYSDPRVRVIVNDARKVFRELEEQSYDMVVFGALDAHTQLGHSSVRLDNYVFTVESIREATRLVRPGGSVVISAAALGWIQQRFIDLMEAGCGHKVEATTFFGRSIHVTCQVKPEAGSGSTDGRAGVEQKRIVPHDDWPFIYLPKPEIPAAYMITILLLTVISILFLKYGGLDIFTVGFFRGHMFFLGAGFLLMEVYAINRLALIYGTTWIVSAIAIGLVLILIILANATTALVRRDLRWFAYIGLFLTLLLSYSLDMATALEQGAVVTALVSVAIVSPVYFAGIIFAKSFSVSSIAGASIGANILGAVLGGWFEYTTMVTGIRSMTIFAAALYAMSLLCLYMYQRRSSP